MTDYINYGIFRFSSALHRPLFWMGSSFGDLLALPKQVRRKIGFALRIAQAGGRYSNVKALKGCGGGGVMEIVVGHEGNTFRAVYSSGFTGVVYALHVFQKKSSQGVKTSKRDLELIRRRSQSAKAHYLTWSESHEKKDT